MIGQFPIVSFDTSSHNRLLKDGAQSEAIFAGFKSGMFFRFAALSVDEMIATKDPGDREALRASFGRLQHGPADCIYPHNELVTRMVVAHSKDPAGFDWKTVDVRARDYEKGIRERDLVADEKLSLDQRTAQAEAGKVYKEIFARLRSKLEEVLKVHGEVAPLTFIQAVARAEGAEPNLVVAIGKDLYDRVAGGDASEATIKQFIAACPPFRAIVYALLMTWYDVSLADPVKSERFKAGRNDLFMATHLPYCDKFVTNDAEQERCLREIAAVAGLETEIISHDAFCDSFLIVA
jgi:hypothetical protein